jgi:hypothetical protein
VNDGNTINLTTGKFSAPRPGIYFFTFTGLTGFPASTSTVNLRVGLYLNGDRIGLAYVEQANTVAGQNSPLTLQSSVNAFKIIKTRKNPLVSKFNFKSSPRVPYAFYCHNRPVHEIYNRLRRNAPSRNLICPYSYPCNE